MAEYTKFTIRSTKPEAGNKCYIRKGQGGWSPSIYGKPTDCECNVLSNCVGYACGRFAEIMNEIEGTYGIKYQEIGKHNAKAVKYYAEQIGLETGSTPKPGSIMCYGQAEGGYGSQGHVIMVEDVVDDKHIIISDSAYGGAPFRAGTASLNKNGTWKIRYIKDGGCWSPTGLQGFVYNPSVKEIFPEPIEEEKYKINLNVGCGGSASIDKCEAEEGTEINIVINPDCEHEICKVESCQVEIEDNKFIMPDEDVIININFKGKQEEQKSLLDLIIEFISGIIKLIFGKGGK